MKTIGLLGGMSWESSSAYYRIINETVMAKLGGLHSAHCIMYSVDFAEVDALQHASRWDEAADLLGVAAQRVQDAGADFLVICTNTMHKVADRIQQHITIPILHIADATARQIQARGISRVALLGTRFTMEEDFYIGRLRERYGLEVLLPVEEERKVIHRIIYDELCLGEIRIPSKEQYVAIIERLADQGAEGVILGCTEIGLLVQSQDSRVPLFDTTHIHAVAAVGYALAAEHEPL